MPETPMRRGEDSPVSVANQGGFARENPKTFFQIRGNNMENGGNVKRS